ncbi:MAG: hypothetical protein R3E01_07125 [Pirellulaceae bacterium]|nr:hypothetical protein [Planctomycetales bacterium]
MQTKTDLESLIHDLQSSDRERSRAAARHLATMGPEAAPAAVALLELCGSDAEYDKWAIVALEEMGSPRQADADQLAGMLRNNCETVAYWAATLLGRLGSAADQTVSQLAQAMESSGSMAVRERSAWALGRMGPAIHRVSAQLHRTASGQHKRLARLAATAIESTK